VSGCQSHHWLGKLEAKERAAESRQNLIDTTTDLVITEGLTKRYGRGVLALDAITLKIGPGVTGLVGANGAGKSTLIKILLGLLEPTSGDASMLGFGVRTQGVEIRQFVGYMPEHDCLPPDVSATDFVAHMGEINGLPRTAARERTAEVLRHVGLFEERYRAMGGYSTGMKQRVKLAQALVHDPKLLLLDEPTNGLDPEGRDEMLDLIGRVGGDFGISIIMSSHLLGEIERVCESLVVIDSGRLMQADTISSFTKALQVLAVEVDARQDELAQRLTAQGLNVNEDGRLLMVQLDGIDPYGLVLDEVVEMGVGLIRMEQRHHRLEDLFRVEPEHADA
jgi:ABC-2 type transport system ATP-binding protein